MGTKTTKFIKEYPYLKKLCNEMGAGAAAEAMDLSPSTLSGAMRDDKVKKVYEIAASKMWEERHPTKSFTLFNVKVPAHNHEIVKSMLIGLGGEFGVRFTEQKF